MGIFKRIMILLLGLTLLLFASGGIYLSDFYEADGAALQAMTSDEDITVTVTGKMAVFSPAQPSAGFIFYPGGKVEFTAYAPLMQALARENILCVLLQMPGNLAVLDMDAAAEIPKQFPQIQHWYLGGHSLGGSMAASWAAGNSQVLEGLVLLASYSTADLSETALKALSIDGTEDGVLNREKQAQYAPNLPENTLSISIPGGNHGQFGSYGLQEGDAIAAISPEEQIAITVDVMIRWLREP